MEQLLSQEEGYAVEHLDQEAINAEFSALIGEIDAEFQQLSTEEKETIDETEFLYKRGGLRDWGRGKQGR